MRPKRKFAPLPVLCAALAVSAAGCSPEPALVTNYCTNCHNEELLTGDLDFDSEAMANVSRHPEIWEKVLQKLRMGAMPPPGEPRPDGREVETFVAWLEAELETVATRSPDPGRPGSVHRLNRSEYQNAIRDLLGLDIEVDSLLPVDDADRNGFDNVATVLSVSPALLERYLAAARKLSRLALGLPPVGPSTDTIRVPPTLDQDGPVGEELPFGSRGGFAVRHYFPVDGEYTIRIRLRRQLYDYIVGLGSPHELDVRIDGERVMAATVGAAAAGQPPPASFVGEVSGDPAWEQYALSADEGLVARFPVRAGPRLVGASFLSRLAELEDGVRPPTGNDRQAERDEMWGGNPALDSITIEGPFTVAGPGDTPSRRAILQCRPATVAEERPCAQQILSSTARRAYRRPVTEEEVATLLRFFDEGRASGEFDAGLQFGIERILADPNFFFRVEREPDTAEQGAPYALPDLELASRLSFFLWSSVPDEALIELAVRGELADDEVLEQQVRRMLADPRSSALVDNFVSQWLQLRPLRSVSPSQSEYPEFDEDLRRALIEETELFVGSTLREDRSVVELLRSDYTFLNERLARHYEIPGVYGNRLRRVSLGDDRRGGILSHGSILTVTSYPNRTSPVLRGKWLLENIFGTPPPRPPPDVPPLPDKAEDGQAASVRQRLEAHRENIACRGCHAPMDPLGFALENYDGVGAWRATNEAGAPVDATGMLPDGAAIEGLPGLRTLLMERRAEFVATLTEKLLSYAVGRGLEYYDYPTTRRIVREAAASDYRWSTLIVGVTKSMPFRMSRTRDEEPGTLTAQRR